MLRLLHEGTRLSYEGQVTVRRVSVRPSNHYPSPPLDDWISFANTKEGKLVGKGVRRPHFERATVQQSPDSRYAGYEGRLWWWSGAFTPLESVVH